MTRLRRSALYGAGIMEDYFLLIFNTHISFQSCNRRSTINIRRSPTDNIFWNRCITCWGKMRSSKRIALSKEFYSIFQVFAIYEISVEPLEKWTQQCQHVWYYSVPFAFSHEAECFFVHGCFSNKIVSQTTVAIGPCFVWSTKLWMFDSQIFLQFR